MARSRAIDTRLERLVPAMEEYFVKGIFTQQQLQEIARQRTNHEYKLVARPLLYVDVRRAVDFELELEAQVSNFVSTAQIRLKHRTAIVERVAHIYEIAIPNLDSNEDRCLLEKQYLHFLRDFSRTGELSRYLAAALQKSPSNATVWIFSVEWELDKGNIDNARSIAQEALKHLSADPRAWIALLKVETRFVSQIAKGVLETDTTVKTSEVDSAANGKDTENARSASTPSTRFAQLNAPLAKIVLDGALVTAAIGAAVQSRALGVELLTRVASLLSAEGDAGIVGALASKREDLFDSHVAHAASGNSSNNVCGAFLSKFFSDSVDVTTTTTSSTSSNKNSKNAANGSAPSSNFCSTNPVLAVQAALFLVCSPYIYFFDAKPDKKLGSTHRFWTPREFLDSSDKQVTASTGGAAASCSQKCAEVAALRTLAALVSLSRETNHPLAAKAALQFAENVSTQLQAQQQQSNNAKKAKPTSTTNSDITARIIATFSNATNSAKINSSDANDDKARCSCQLALDECLSAATQKMPAIVAFLNRSKTNRASKVGTLAAAEFPWREWVGASFANLLSESVFSISQLVPSLGAVSGAADTIESNNNNSDDLMRRARQFLSGLQSGTTPTLSPTEMKQLQQSLDTWFAVLKKKVSGSSSHAQPDILTSDTLADQFCILLLSRALLHGQGTTQKASPNRRQRVSSDDDNNDDDDDDNGRACVSSEGIGFVDVVQLFKFVQPTTPKQFETRSRCLAVVGSVWIEFLLTIDTKSGVQFPFVVRDFASLNADSALETQLQTTNRRDQLRRAVDVCASVLPPSVDLLVHVAAGIEFCFAKKAISSSPPQVADRTTAESRMRNFFEAAIAQQPKMKATWQSWRAFEMQLGNLKIAGDVQRRAASTIGDVRFFL